MRDVEITRPEKVLFPDDAITKQDLADYYARAAETMLPHVRDRPLTLQRFPNGIGQKGFFQKEVSKHFPEWVERAAVRKRDGSSFAYPLANNAETLVYLAGQAAITLHVWPARVDDLTHPDRLIFDLDPPGEDRFPVVRSTALIVRSVLEEVGLVPFAMTTGSKGLHVVAPIDRAAAFDDVYDFAEDVGKVVLRRDPDCCTTEFRKANREGRLFFDTRRNAYGQHAVAPYSVRPKPGAPIATPLEWDEVEDRKLTATRYTIRTIFDRLESTDDPWRGISRRARSLDGPRRKLSELLASDV